MSKKTPRLIAKDSLKEKKGPRSPLPVYGVGPDGRFYKWVLPIGNGLGNWAEPNPVIVLNQISASHDASCLWALAAKGRIFNSSAGPNLGIAWSEPNPAKRLNQISGDGTVVWGIGTGNRAYKSDNNGITWYEPDPAQRLKQISVGYYNNVWAVKENGLAIKFDGSTWLTPSSQPLLKQVSAMFSIGAWGIDLNNHVWVNVDGTSWTEPNSAAGLYQISAIDDVSAWGVGAANRVFQTHNRGQQWLEPNPQAGLKEVSAV